MTLIGSSSRFAETGEALVSSVDKVIFVGSPGVGKMVWFFWPIEWVHSAITWNCIIVHCFQSLSYTPFIFMMASYFPWIALYANMLHLFMQIMNNAANTLTPVTLELGGKDAFIVCEDVDLDHVWILSPCSDSPKLGFNYYSQKLNEISILEYLSFNSLWSAEYRLHKLLSGLYFSQVDRTVLGQSDFMSIGKYILLLLA